MCQLNIKQELCKSSHSKWFKWKVLNVLLHEYWLQISVYPEENSREGGMGRRRERKKRRREREKGREEQRRKELRGAGTISSIWLT